MKEIKRYYIGPDVHKESIVIAVADEQSREEPKFIGTTGFSVNLVHKALQSLRTTPEQISIAYEAGCQLGRNIDPDRISLSDPIQIHGMNQRCDTSRLMGSQER